MQKYFLGWILLSIVVSGCSESRTEDDHGNEEGDQYAAVESPVPDETGIAKTHIVEIKGMKFVPDILNVRKGDTVVWINKGIVDHDVTEQDSSLWTSGKMVPGSSWKMAVERSGNYYCSIHVVMKGRLIVETAESILP